MSMLLTYIQVTPVERYNIFVSEFITVPFALCSFVENKENVTYVMVALTHPHTGLADTY